MKKLYTSYFAKYKGSNAVAISQGIPEGFRGSWLKGLAPDWKLVKAYKQGQITFQQLADAYIRDLDERGIEMDVLVNMFEEGTVFLCWEKSGTPCHRHILAELMNRTGLVTVTELE